ncbi:FecR family protein [Algoriphagus antarcticus]|nr:FecR domain-containing protein [Algoriphagus antarcticus]
MEKYFDNPSPRFTDETDYDLLLNSIHQKIITPKAKNRGLVRSLTSRSLKIAASVILCFFLGYALVQSFTYKDSQSNTESESLISSIVRTTGPGEKLTLLMSDKTKITVNALSEISFSSDYGKNDRIINITGEAYFEVASNPSKPFKVISNGITTTALGTEFNVFARENDYRIALVEGKVAVAKASKEVALSPGQMAVWNYEKNAPKDFSIQSFNQERTTSWKEGVLIFNRKPFWEILNDLEAWYGVKFKVDKGIDTKSRIIGSYENKNLKDILTGLSFSLGFEFVIEGKIVHIKKSKTMN